MAASLTNLAAARSAVADEASLRIYTKLLADLSPILVSRACMELALEPRRDYETALPSVGTIRERAAALQAHADQIAATAKLLPMPASEDDPRTFVFCTDCQDEPSGWRIFWCHGSGNQFRENPSARDEGFQRGPCDRKIDHAAHTFVVRCHCYGTNPKVAKAKG
jgi:hypothetical protein